MDDLTLRATLRDELSQPLRKTEERIEHLTRAVDRLDRAGRRRPLDSLVRGNDTLSRAARGAHSAVGRLSDFIGTRLISAARTGAVVLGGLAAAATGFAITSAMNLENSKVALEALTGSQAEANRVFSFLTELDPNVPFDLGQLSQTAVALSSVNIAGEHFRSMMQGIADVAAGTARPGENLERIARAVTQMHSADTVLMEELNQLVDAGVAVGPALERAYGMTLAQFRDAQSRGGAGLDPDLFFETLFGMRAGTAQKVATETLSGLISGAKSEVMLALSDETGPLMAALKGALPGITDSVVVLINEVAPPLLGLVGDLADVFADLLPVVSPVFTAIFDGLGMILEASRPAMGALGPVFDDIALSISHFFRELIPHMPTFVDLMINLLAIAPPFIEALASGLPHLAAFAGVLNNILEHEGVVDLLGRLFAAVWVLGALEPITSVVLRLVGAIGKLLSVVARSGNFLSKIPGLPGSLRAAFASAGASAGAIAGVGASYELLKGPEGRLPGTPEPTYLDGGLIAGIGRSGLLGEVPTYESRLDTRYWTTPSQSSVPASASSPSYGLNAGATFGPTHIVVHNPKSELDIERAVKRGLREGAREKIERGDGSPSPLATLTRGFMGGG